MDKKKKKIWIVISAIVLVLLILAGVFLFRGCQNQESGSGGMIFDPNAEPYDPSSDIAADHVSGIAIPGYGNIYFPSDETTVQITLYNPEKNDCLFRFELYIDDENEPIASTELIEPGKAVQTVTLSRPLTKGEYSLNIKVLPYTKDDLTPLNNALVYAKLYVL